jgi:cytochrome P450
VTCTLKAVEEEELGDKVPLEGRGMLVRALLSSSASMSEQQLADSCLNFLTAGERMFATFIFGLISNLIGRDTTAQALTWTLYRLLLNSSYFTALRAEIDALPSISPLDLASHLPLTEAAIAETLRLHPPIPIEILENVSLEPVVLPNGKIVGPGEQIMWSPWVMARLNPPKSNYRGIWGDNPEQFKPERWFNLDHKPTAYESPVFHAGPRACLGRPLANLELVYALKEVLVRFEFQMAWDGGMRGVGSGLTAPMVGGLPVRVKRRSNPEQERTAKA